MARSSIGEFRTQPDREAQCVCPSAPLGTQQCRLELALAATPQGNMGNRGIALCRRTAMVVVTGALCQHAGRRLGVLDRTR